MKSVSFDELSDFLGPVLLVDQAAKVMEYNEATQVIFEDSAIEIKDAFIGDLLSLESDLPIADLLKSKDLIKAQVNGDEPFPLELKFFEREEGFLIAMRPCHPIKKLILSNQALEKDIEQFIYSISHDLKAPVRGISTLSGWLQDDLKELLNEEQVETLKLLTRKTQELNSLMGALLNYSRIGRVSYFKKHLDVQPIIKKVSKALVLLNPEIKINYPEEAIYTQMDATLAEQLFFLILENCIDHNNTENLEVEIKKEQQNKFHLLSIKDNGKGMSEKTVSKAFDLFYKNTTLTKVGMGLTLAKKIVSVSSGRINLYSVPEEGTTVQIWLPFEELVENVTI